MLSTPVRGRFPSMAVKNSKEAVTSDAFVVINKRVGVLRDKATTRQHGGRRRKKENNEKREGERERERKPSCVACVACVVRKKNGLENTFVVCGPMSFTYLHRPPAPLVAVLGYSHSKLVLVQVLEHTLQILPVYWRFHRTLR